MPRRLAQDATTPGDGGWARAVGITAVVLLIAALFELARRRIRAIEAENERLKAEMGSVEAENERLHSELHAAAQPTPIDGRASLPEDGETTLRVQWSGSTLSSLSRQSSTPAAEGLRRVRGRGLARQNSVSPTTPSSRQLSAISSSRLPASGSSTSLRAARAWQPSRPPGGGNASEREADLLLCALLGLNPTRLCEVLSCGEAEARATLRSVAQQAAAVTIQAAGRAARSRRRRQQLFATFKASIHSADGEASAATCLVFGAINMDLKAVSDASWHRSATTTTGAFFSQPGGRGANQAVALARLGVRAVMVGRVGTDEMGRILRRHLLVESRLFSHVHVGDEATGVAVQLVTSKDNSKATVVCQGANDAIAEGGEEVAAATRLLEKASGKRVVLVQLELPGEPTLQVVVAAHKAGGEVVLKASPLPAGDAHQLLKATRLLDSEAVSVLFVNEWEAPELLAPRWAAEKGGGPVVTARQAEEAATLLMERWPAVQTVVVTCMFGCVLRSAGRAEGG